MKDEGFLDSAGPVFIITALMLVMALTSWVMVRGNAQWGSTEAPAEAVTEVARGH